MKIGVIADTHIPANAAQLPEKVKSVFKNVDMIIHAGDLVDASVIAELRTLCPQVEIVAGNMDASPALADLPRKKIIKAGTFTIGVIHGWGGAREVPAIVRKEFKHADVIVFGHSHQPLNERRDGVLLFNPGSATDSVFAPYRSVGLLTIESGVVTGEIVRL